MYGLRTGPSSAGSGSITTGTRAVSAGRASGGGGAITGSTGAAGRSGSRSKRFKASSTTGVELACQLRVGLAWAWIAIALRNLSTAGPVVNCRRLASVAYSNFTGRSSPNFTPVLIQRRMVADSGLQANARETSVR